MSGGGQQVGYGTHPTGLVDLSDAELYSMYCSETWKGLDETGRLELLQETVNRSANANGELGSCKVSFAGLGPATAGFQKDGSIEVNRDMFVNDRQTVEYNGSLITRDLPDANMRALTTVLHEDQHAYQDQVIRGEIQARDQAAADQYRANDFTPVPVTAPDGTAKIGSTYLTGEAPGLAGYYLYYFQATERDAHLLSETKAMQIMADLEAKYGQDKSFDAFRQEMAANGYAATAQKAAAAFKVADPEAEINRALSNHYYGTNEPVAPQVDSLVRAEMILSYENSLQVSSKPAVQTGRLDAHVSRDEYDATLRSAVNSTYEHLKSDPSVSKEEAFRMTAEMSEKYLTAVEAFEPQADKAGPQAVSQAQAENALPAVSAGEQAPESGNAPEGLGPDSLADAAGEDNTAGTDAGLAEDSGLDGGLGDGSGPDDSPGDDENSLDGGLDDDGNGLE